MKHHCIIQMAVQKRIGFVFREKNPKEDDNEGLKVSI